MDPVPDSTEGKQNPTSNEKSEAQGLSNPSSVKPDEEPPVVLTPAEALKKETEEVYNKLIEIQRSQEKPVKAKRKRNQKRVSNQNKKTAG